MQITPLPNPKDTPYLGSRIPPARLDFLAAKCTETLQHIPGNILEIGVYKGGSIIRLAALVKRICPQNIACGIDTFEGHLVSDGHPAHPAGKYNDVRLSLLQEAISDTDLGGWIKLLKGPIEEIFPELGLSHISFAHVDCDLYQPVKYCALNLPSIMSVGGRIYFDDYGSEDCPGATAAVDEVFTKDKITLLPHSCYVDL